jgi:TrmH family RNA methyltransferase
MVMIFKGFVRFVCQFSTMLSKNDIKLIRSLEQVKFRKKHAQFVAEGSKVINELIGSGLSCRKIFTTNETLFDSSIDVQKINAKALNQLSFLSHPKDALALFDLPARSSIDLNQIKQDFALACDCIQDPGNLGTILRIADWFGIKQVICSEDTADVYNPKVVQSTMGSIGRVNVVYVNLTGWIEENKAEFPIMVAALGGDNIYESSLPSSGLIVLGNEARGVSKEIVSNATRRLLIPGTGKAESLNVAVSAGILCAEVRRPKSSPQT